MSELKNAIKQICEEKGLSYEAVIGTIESALAAAYRKDYGKKNQNILVEFDPDTAKSKVYDVKTVVEDQPEIEEEDAELSQSSVRQPADKAQKPEKPSAQKSDDGQAEEKKAEGLEAGEAGSVAAVETEEEPKFNPKTMMELSDAKMIKKTVKIGDEIRMKLEPPSEYGRMAAQTAKQVIIQRLREAEREMVFADFKEKEHEVLSGVVQRREGRVVLVDLGKSTGVLGPDDMIPGEQYRPGDRIKVFVKDVSARAKGPEIVLSRVSDEILKKIFYLEIPEISNGLIDIKSVAREAGFRSKVAVWTDSQNVDPIGSCVGQRGARIQTIISELGGEKVDIILYDEDNRAFIQNALSPAKILEIKLDEKEKRAEVKVAEDQLSLAIGKGGQNARLAAKLTGWKVDIVSENSGKKEKAQDEKDSKEPEAPVVAEVQDEAQAKTPAKETKAPESPIEAEAEISADDTKAEDENIKE